MMDIVFFICPLHEKVVIRTDHGQWRHVRNNGSLGPECTEGVREQIRILDEWVENDDSQV